METKTKIDSLQVLRVFAFLGGGKALSQNYLPKKVL